MQFRQRWPLWLAAMALAPWLVNRVAPLHIDADTLIPVFASTQKLTLFYWGQDRYASLLPALCMPILNVESNLRVQLWLAALGLLLLLEAIADAWLRSTPQPPSPWLRWASWLLAVGLLCLQWRPFALSQFGAAPQPYAVPCLLGTWSATQWSSTPRFGQRVTASVLLIAALGINPALVALAVPAALLLGRPWWPWLRAAVLVAAAWLVLGRLSAGYAPRGYDAWQWTDYPAMFAMSVRDLRDHALRPRYVVASLACTAALAPWLPRPLVWRLAGVLAVGVLWWLTFLGNGWVQVNHVAFRYFFPLCLAPVVAATGAGTAWLCRLRPRAARLATLLLGAALIAWLPRPWVALDDYALFGPARAPLAVARAEGVRYLAGDYWAAWPAVFLAHREGVPLDGAFSRGIARQAEIREELAAAKRAGREIRALCVRSGGATCQDQLLRVTGQAWQLDRQLPGGFAVLTP